MSFKTSVAIRCSFPFVHEHRFTFVTFPYFSFATFQDKIGLPFLPVELST